jgi:hypothetical protein
LTNETLSASGDWRTLISTASAPWAVTRVQAGAGATAMSATALRGTTPAAGAAPVLITTAPMSAALVNRLSTRVR